MKESKALERVWEWKKEVYQEIKNMTRSERVAYFRDAARALQEKTGKSVKLRRAGRRGRARASRRSQP